MAGLSTISNIWNNVREVDLRPIRQEGLRGVKIAIAGKTGAGRKTLAEALRRDPSHPDRVLQTPVLILNLDQAGEAADVDLIILVLDGRERDFSRQKAAARSWTDAGKPVLVFVNHSPDSPGPAAPGPWIDWGQKRVVYGSVQDSTFLLKDFAPAVMEIVPELLLALGRNFPLFRVPVAQHLINETSFNNASYSLTTGLAEIVPGLGIPLNVADMVVLTKSQAFLIYRLGLALGLSERWQDYVAEFGGVLGGGFMWRQLARSLVGLIPAWGIIPKVAIAYSGTYVVGNVILQWYLTGRHLDPKQMRALSAQAFQRGKILARTLVEKTPRPRLNRPGKAALPAPQKKRGRGRPVCSNCGRTNSRAAAFCQYCGQLLDDPPAALPSKS